MSRSLRRRCALALLGAVGLVFATAFVAAAPASAAAAPPCHEAAGDPPPASTPMHDGAPCGSVIPLLCCSDRTAVSTAAVAAPAPPLPGLVLPASAAVLPAAAPFTPVRIVPFARAGPLPSSLNVLRL